MSRQVLRRPSLHLRGVPKLDLTETSTAANVPPPTRFTRHERKRCSLTSSDLDRTARAVAGFLAVRGLLVQLSSQLDDLLERLGASKSAWSDWLAAVDPAIAPAPETSGITGQFGRKTCANYNAG